LITKFDIKGIEVVYASLKIDRKVIIDSSEIMGLLLT